MGKWQEAAVLATLTMGVLAHAGEQEQKALLNQSAEQLLRKSRDAYTILDRANLSKALAAKGVSALSQLSGAIRDEHWHVRHCALMAIKELAKDAGNRAAIKPLVPNLGQLVVQDPHHAGQSDHAGRGRGRSAAPPRGQQGNGAHGRPAIEARGLLCADMAL